MENTQNRLMMDNGECEEVNIDDRHWDVEQVDDGCWNDQYEGDYDQYEAIMISMKAIMMILLTSRARKTRRKEKEKMEIGSVMVVLCRLDTTPVCHTLKQILCSKLLSYE